MPATVNVARNAGHPWDNRPGFDHLYLDAETQAELDRAVAAAKLKFWSPWLIGVNEITGKPGGVLYKPSGISEAWRDSGAAPHPGRCSA